MMYVTKHPQDFVSLGEYPVPPPPYRSGLHEIHVHMHLLCILFLPYSI